MILGVGTDLIEIRRMEKACKKDYFVVRTFTDMESRQAKGSASKLDGSFAVKEAVAKAVTAEAVATAGYDSVEAAAKDGTAFVFMGHGTSHTAKVSYSQMQTAMQTLGYSNVFIGTVEGEPEETACENVIEAVKAAGYTKVILRPLMVVAGDHANNDMAGADDDSWLSQFQASGDFASVECQIAGLGEIEDIQQRYIEHTKAAIDSLNG